MRQYACWLAGGLSAALAVAFWLPFGPTGAGSTGYAPMAGASLSATSTQAPAAAASDQAPMPQARIPLQEQASAPTARVADAPAVRKGVASKPRAHAAMLTASARTPTTAGVEQSTAAPNRAEEPEARPAATPPTPAAPPDYTLESIAQKFENDPSKYPLDRIRKLNGIALGLVAMGRLDRLSVLKVSVANETETDFFVKGFSIQAGSAVLGSRSLFRILVEPGRMRVGYVLFEKPPSGACVKIKLKEDGGKGLAVEMPVPYPF